MKTAEQKAADNALSEAVEAAAKAYSLVGDSMLIDFMVIVEGISFDSDGEPDRDFIGIAFKNGATRKSVGVGLCTQAIDMLLHGEPAEDE